MPTDPAMLAKIGLRDIPRWYRDKYGVPSIQANGHRGHMGHGQHWKEGNDRGAFKTIQYAPRTGMNGNNDSAEFDKPKHKQGHLPVQHSGMIPDQPRSFGNVNNGGINGRGGARKHGPKHMGTQQHPNGGKKIDLLSFDPLPDHPNLDSGAGGMGELSFYSAGSHGDPSSNEDPDRVQREGFVRHLQSMAPGHADTSMQGSFDGAGSQGRSNAKRTYRSRRLYQRANTTQSTHGDGTNEVEDVNAHANTNANVFHDQHGITSASASFPTLTSGASTLSKASNLANPFGSRAFSSFGGTGMGLGMGMGIGGTALSSGPPTRDVSPENLSHSSMSMRSSPFAPSSLKKQDSFGSVKYPQSRLSTLADGSNDWTSDDQAEYDLMTGAPPAPALSPLRIATPVASSCQLPTYYERPEQGSHMFRV